MTTKRLIEKRDILVITTGGTIDSHYDPAKGTPYHVPQDGGSYIPQAAQELGYGKRCKVDELCVKDSKNVGITELYRMIKLAGRQYDKVIVTHGTDYMPRNARALKDLMKRHGLKNKTVVFTGAMTPLRDDTFAIRSDSDGWENLSLAFSEVDKQPAGVYIAIDGKLHEAETLNKRVDVDGSGMVQQSGFVERILRSSDRVDAGEIKR